MSISNPNHMFQTNELDDFKNLTERASQSLISETETDTYVIAPRCFMSCISRGAIVIKSDNLIEEFASNISTTAFPKLSEIFEIIRSQLLNSTKNDTAIPDFIQFDNILGDKNDTYKNESFYNDTISIVESLNITDLTYSFVDYLTFILHSLISSNQTLLDNLNESSTSPSTTELSTTDLSTTEFSTVDNYELLKSTLAPILAKTLGTTESTDVSRFDYDSENDYNEIIPTISSMKNNCTEICENIKILATKNITMDQNMNYTMKARLRSLCWETMFGQELVRLTVMDLVMTIGSTLAMDFFRGIFVRVMNR